METNAAAARKKLHHFIDEIEDKRVENLYYFLRAEIDDEEFELTDELKAELDQIADDMDKGTLETRSWEDVKKTMEDAKSKR